MTTRASSVLLTLADGRFPAGGYAHSGGLEEAVASGRVRDIAGLSAFLTGRLGTVGRVEAALSALSWSAAPSPSALWGVDAEATARSPSPAQRQASRAQARGLLRAARAIWPAPLGWAAALDGPLPRGPMYPIALGAVGKSLGLGAEEVALVAAQGSVAGPAWAATRLLGLDPFEVGRCISTLAPAVEEVARVASAGARPAPGPAEISELPAYAAPLLEIGAEAHARWEVRLFAS